MIINLILISALNHCGVDNSCIYLFSYSRCKHLLIAQYAKLWAKKKKKMDISKCIKHRPCLQGAQILILEMTHKQLSIVKYEICISSVAF